MTRSNEDIRVAIESAFKPLSCVAEIWDYDTKIRFRVFSPNGEPLVTYSKVVISHLRSDTALNIIITGVRKKLESKGFALASWHLP